MSILETSYVARFFYMIFASTWTVYEKSYSKKLVDGFFLGCENQWRQSFLGRSLGRESILSKSWGDSLTCRGILIILNLPTLLLRTIYKLLEKFIEESYACKFIFALGESTAIITGWLFVLLVIIPYDYWNNAYSLMAFVLVFLFFLIFSMRKKERVLDVVALGPYTFAFWFFVCLAVPFSMYYDLSFRFIYYHISCMLAVILIVSMVEKAEDLRRLAGAATLGLCGISLYGVYQGIQGVEVNASYVDLSLNADMPGRVFSFYDNPNALGEVLVMLIPVAVGLIFAGKSIWSKLLGVAGTGLGGLALIMTYSRAGWVGLAVAAVVFIFLWWKKILPLCLFLGFAMIPLLPDTVFNRILTIFNLEDTSTSSRFPLYEATLRLIGITPIEGAGLGSEAVRQAVTDLGLYDGASPFVHGHNIYLQVWAETGFFGILSLLATIGYGVKRSFSIGLKKLGDSSSRMLVIASVSAIIGIMVCGLADYIWHYPRVMLIFWFVFALLLAGIRLVMREEEKSA